jgi:hypothetical protein
LGVSLGDLINSCVINGKRKFIINNSKNLPIQLNRGSMRGGKGLSIENPCLTPRDWLNGWIAWYFEDAPQGLRFETH